MTGPRSVPVYIVHVVPRTGSGGLAAQTPIPVPTEVTTTIIAGSIPTKYSILPVVAIGALAPETILGVLRRE